MSILLLDLTERPLSFWRLKMTPYKDYVQKRRTDDVPQEDVFTGVLVCIALGGIIGVMLGFGLIFGTAI